MSTATWTIADLADLTEQAMQMSMYCEHCGVVQTTEQYCDDCATDIVNWLLWEDYTQQEQWFNELDAMRYEEETKVGNGLY